MEKLHHYAVMRRLVALRHNYKGIPKRKIKSILALYLVTKNDPKTYFFITNKIRNAIGQLHKLSTQTVSILLISLLVSMNFRLVANDVAAIGRNKLFDAQC